MNTYVHPGVPTGTLTRPLRHPPRTTTGLSDRGAPVRPHCSRCWFRRCLFSFVNVKRRVQWHKTNSAIKGPKRVAVAHARERLPGALCAGEVPLLWLHRRHSTDLQFDASDSWFCITNSRFLGRLSKPQQHVCGVRHFPAPRARPVQPPPLTREFSTTETRRTFWLGDWNFACSCASGKGVGREGGSSAFTIAPTPGDGPKTHDVRSRAQCPILPTPPILRPPVFRSGFINAQTEATGTVNLLVETSSGALTLAVISRGPQPRYLNAISTDPTVQRHRLMHTQVCEGKADSRTQPPTRRGGVGGDPRSSSHTRAPKDVTPDANRTRVICCGHGLGCRLTPPCWVRHPEGCRGGGDPQGNSDAEAGRSRFERDIGH